MKLPHKTLEKKLLTDGYRYVIGVDEVGMGALAGPVVVCAVSFRQSFFQRRHQKLFWLRDSKLLSQKKREQFAQALLKEPGLKYRLAFSQPAMIDRINIYQAALRAMRRAINRMTLLQQGHPVDSVVLVDGPHKIPGLELNQIPVVKGDRKVFAIACASIIAKVHRDRMMTRYARKFPDYGFEKHKGYSTKYHQTQLASLGPSPIHRLSFAPISKLL